ncbi:uncharacterized protein PAC_12771, partial [Phialocephala subalpina]
QLPDLFEKYLLCGVGNRHTPECFQNIIPKFEALSYPTAYVNLATVGGHNPAATHLDDVIAIHAVTVPLMNEGKEIMLVPHSYGGIPVCASIEGQTVAERSARGEKGGITSVFFIASFALERKGMSCTETFAADADYIDFAGAFGVVNENAKRALYNDLSPEQADYWLSRCKPHALVSFAKPVDFVPPDLTIPSTYLIYENDGALRLSLQEQLVAATPGMKSVRFHGGHSPFLSHPDFVVDAMVKAAEEISSDKMPSQL